MTSKLAYICIDQGGQSSRALLFDVSGKVLCQAQRPVTTNHLQAGQVEQNPKEMLQSVQACIDGALSAVPVVYEVAAIGIVGQRSSFICWHAESGQPLTPIISWQDTRAADELQALGLDSSQVRQRTGLFPNAHFGASKMRWCLQHNAQVSQAALDGALRISPLVSWLAHCLSDEGVNVVDPSNAGRTLLFDLSTQQWSKPLMQAFGVLEDYLPAPVPNVADFGHVGGVPLRYLNGDQASSVLALGPFEPGELRVNLGTGLFACCEFLPHNTEPLHLLRSQVLSAPEKSIQVIEATVNGGASALAWLDQQPEGEKSHQIPLFLNAVGGLASPFWRSDIAPVLPSGDKAQQRQAAIESMAFLLRENLAVLSQHQYVFDKVVVSGGLSHDATLLQAMADVLQLPVYRSDQTETTALGMLVALGMTIKAPMRLVAKPAHNALLMKRYARWQSLLQSALKH